MKRVIKCAKHDEYAFYRVVGPLSVGGRSARPSEIGRSPHLVVVTWK